MLQTRTAGRNHSRTITLAAFFKMLENKPELLERFSEGREGREEVLRHFKLSPADRRMLLDGAQESIALTINGQSEYPMYTTSNINIPLFAIDNEDCGHASCKAFLTAAKKH